MKEGGEGREETGRQNAEKRVGRMQRGEEGKRERRDALKNVGVERACTLKNVGAYA